ncbi:hypothetical protein [Riemerella columbipharyngis]|uniref:Uncharacterized protein n=1 Tax=Riemerella columbipharyngis TaxID=1071918 RepID=A0A1G7F0D0_9FLAO|nr:hypothetical protein [Riemerella columbipharyngis]SDE69307.1 hypothetical protein SAMN05421544_11843 [Riemerella columbipharyngis]
MDTNRSTDISFELKLANWLTNESCFMEHYPIQEDIFELMDSIEVGGYFQEDEVEFLVSMLKSYLKLSFIIKKHPDKTEKLINFLK